MEVLYIAYGMYSQGRFMQNHCQDTPASMWRTGYVGTVNLRSHMPTMKIRQPKSGLRDLPSMMDLHEWLTLGNTTRTHQGVDGPPRELPSLPLFTLRSSFARCERALWRHLLATRTKENCTPSLGQPSPRPRQRRHHRRSRPLC